LTGNPESPALILQTGVQLFQTFILLGETAIAGGIHDQCYFSFVLTQVLRYIVLQTVKTVFRTCRAGEASSAIAGTAEIASDPVPKAIFSSFAPEKTEYTVMLTACDYCLLSAPLRSVAEQTLFCRRR
jgi:hypothetical protein